MSPKPKTITKSHTHHSKTELKDGLIELTRLAHTKKKTKKTKTTPFDIVLTNYKMVTYILIKTTYKTFSEEAQ